MCAARAGQLFNRYFLDTGLLCHLLRIKSPRGVHVMAWHFRRRRPGGKAGRPGCCRPYLLRQDRKPIISLAARDRLPAGYEWPEQVRDGGLLACGTSLDGLCARIAVYVDQLFRGKKPVDLPVDLPVEQPTTFSRR